MSTIYSTYPEAVEELVIEPIEAGGVVKDAYLNYDVKAIAEAVISDYDPEQGGYHELTTDEDFWELVQRHAFAADQVLVEVGVSWSDTVASIIIYRDGEHITNLLTLPDITQEELDKALARAGYPSVHWIQRF